MIITGCYYPNIYTLLCTWCVYNRWWWMYSSSHSCVHALNKLQYMHYSLSMLLDISAWRACNNDHYRLLLSKYLYNAMHMTWYVYEGVIMLDIEYMCVYVDNEWYQFDSVCIIFRLCAVYVCNGSSCMQLIFILFKACYGDAICILWGSNGWYWWKNINRA